MAKIITKIEKAKAKIAAKTGKKPGKKSVKTVAVVAMLCALVVFCRFYELRFNEFFGRLRRRILFRL